MLVLSRKTGESIMIGDQIEVKVLAVEGDQVKLGIVAPKSVKVYRSEVFEAIQEQNKEALNISTDLLEKLKKK
ncbi:carbon storage regulator CsrA [Metasolibacillus meyeri]|uniref:Translational regulator CsrA n=1 Tax=Metasolibacillus meyeri TaxID=1071052 RepID=A0AAW9NSB1_9BACL|nr:carbon storage regulator CsrA [Metasolibacillus meyeri]MEC1178888.1 carbon storage regulator CsrA [Metasolibacillus meyeri]